MELEEVLRVNRALVKVAKLFRSVQAAVLQPLGLHPGQDVLLWILGQEPEGLTVSELAARLGVEPPTVTRSLSRLEAGDWFTRTAVPGDRRRSRIRLTARGRAVIPEIVAAWEQLAGTATGSLSPSERAQLVGLLEQVRDDLIRVAGTEAMAED